jgi:hypothetical protein
MANESPTTVLGNAITAQLAKFDSKRVRDRRKAFGLKMGTVVLGALITVLLGFKTSPEWEPTLKNIELIAGALIVIMNAWDAFYDHKGLWVKRTTATVRLQRLQLEFTMMRAAQPELDAASLRRYQTTLGQILDDDLSSWVQLRTEPTVNGGGNAGAPRPVEHTDPQAKAARPVVEPSGEAPDR